MAISKNVENEYGAKFNYHKLQNIRIVNGSSGVQMTLTVQSWIDKQARIDGKQPTVRQCIISNADFALTPFYALLKAKFPDFTNGTDDFNNDFKKQSVAAEKASDVSYTVQTAQGQLFDRWQE